MLAVLGLAALPAYAASTNLTYNAEAAVKETYDDNVYIQDIQPAPANVAAAQAAGLHPVQADKASFVTTLLPRFTLTTNPRPSST